MGCLVCGSLASAHHVTARADAIGRLPKDHRLVAPLCPDHHQYGPDAVHRLGHMGFFKAHGIDLLAEAQRLEAESVSLGVLPELRAAA
jgi:hypothetical protein